MPTYTEPTKPNITYNEPSAKGWFVSGWFNTSWFGRGEPTYTEPSKTDVIYTEPAKGD